MSPFVGSLRGFVPLFFHHHHAHAMQADYDWALEQLDYAKEQLSLADDMYSKTVWGNRCDQLEDSISDMLSRLEIL